MPLRSFASLVLCFGLAADQEAPANSLLTYNPTERGEIFEGIEPFPGLIIQEYEGPNSIGAHDNRYTITEATENFYGIGRGVFHLKNPKTFEDIFNKIGNCSITYVISDTPNTSTFITADHCLQDQDNAENNLIKATFAYGDKGKADQTIGITIDSIEFTDTDVVFLYSNQDLPDSIRPFKQGNGQGFCEDNLDQHQQKTILRGYSLFSYGLFASKGDIIACGDFEHKLADESYKGTFLIGTHDVIESASGSPVFSDNGEIVALVSSSGDNGETVALAGIPALRQ